MHLITSPGDSTGLQNKQTQVLGYTQKHNKPTHSAYIQPPQTHVLIIILVKLHLIGSRQTLVQVLVK